MDSRPASFPRQPDDRPHSAPTPSTPEARARDAALAAPVELAHDDHRSVLVSRRALLGDVVAGAVDVAFWVLVAGAGRAAGHCRRCDPLATTCTCPCLSCELRRGLHVAASAAAAPVREVSVRSQTLAERVEARWHELQRTGESLGMAVHHCEAGDWCRSNEEVLCECDCVGCTCALDLLIRAEQEVLGEG